MPAETTEQPPYAALYKVRKGTVAFVDVPELGYLAIDGRGDPDGPDFAAAVAALYGVSYTAHFALKKATGAAPKVMPLEALWWLADGHELSLDVTHIDRHHWRWQAMIMQPPPLDDAMVGRAIGAARAKQKTENPALDALRLVRWTEGPAAQLLHVGPYADEPASVARLHQAIADRGARPHGRHHEIYLSDARRTAREKLRTILRQPLTGAPSDGADVGR